MVRREENGKITSKGTTHPRDHAELLVDILVRMPHWETTDNHL